MTATILTSNPVEVVDWTASDSEWLAARNRGISASDVAAALGFSRYATPWEVWADKTGFRPGVVDANKEAIRLGVALEPWLLVQARHLLGVPVVHTDARLYAHPDDRWQLASPDGEARPADSEPYGVECKTAGLAGGFGVPDGWTDDRVPLGYEFQARWQMRVMGWRKVVIVALVAGLGLRTYTVRRDLAIELDLVDQVRDWRERHIIGRAEPALAARDGKLLDDLWPEPTDGRLPLDGDPDIVELVLTYQDGRARETAGKKDKETAAAAIKRKVGGHSAGTIDGREVITWQARRGAVRWRDMAADLYTATGRDPDTLDDDTDTYRNPPTRTLLVKGINTR